MASAFAGPASAAPIRVADLSDPKEATRWRFFTDQVMGGVSTGQATISQGALTLSGRVSTENNGGFIQARRDVALPSDASGLRIRLRGDGQRYYIHLRTRRTRLPWQYYQAAVQAPSAWTTVTVPFDAFRPSGQLLPDRPEPGIVTSVALVAYARDHEADVSLSRIDAI